MNITFLIGNGFDRNLGLKTTYSDFVEEYKKTDAKTQTLKDFRQYINANEKLWSAAEVEMGRYTAEFEEGNGAAFYECHKDFCEKLADYLKDEVLKIEYQYITQDVEKAFSKINSIAAPFPTQERSVLEDVYRNHRSENIIYDFIVYNYTDTLDRCISIARKKQDILGKHTYGPNTFRHTVGSICHVHGTVDTQMVFGVNDRSQIVKPEIFNCEYGDLYQDLLIKIQANQGYQENTDAKAKKILDNSQIIYIYGMSIGITDALWWERICKWLNNSAGRHLIVHRYSMPSRGLLEVDYKIEERKAKREITRFSQLTETQNREIEKRIHVTGDNIFAAMKDIAVKRELSDKELESILTSINETTETIKNSTSYQAVSEYIDKYNAEQPEVTVV